MVSNLDFHQQKCKKWVICELLGVTIFKFKIKMGQKYRHWKDSSNNNRTKDSFL
jgi:hypothetical protein